MAREYVVIDNGNIIGTNVYTASEVRECESAGFTLMTPKQYYESRR